MLRRGAKGSGDASISSGLAGGPKKRGSAAASSVSLGWTLGVYVLLFLWLGFVMGLSWWNYDRLPEVLPRSQVPLDRFSEERARDHLRGLLHDIGERFATTKKNDEDTALYLLETIKSIADNTCKDYSKCPMLEFEIQKASGNFSMFFVEAYVNTIYQNVTNLVIRLRDGREDAKLVDSRKDAVLINAHFDAPFGSIGAGDDSAAIACTLESLRALSVSPPPKHPIIFLLNGAEEALMLGSHGFITSHRWAPTVNAVLNFDSAGTGYLAMLFQAGRGDLIRLYAQHALMPHGSVLAHEIFSSAVIPSDTDYRIFRDFGGVSGLDLAYYRNGYMYHTALDREEFVPMGSLQHMGHTMLEVSRSFANSEVIPDPTSPEATEVPVYFDVWGTWVVSYSLSFAKLLNGLTLLLGAFAMIKCDPRNLQPSGKAPSSLRTALSATWNLLSGILLGLLLSIILAVVISYVTKTPLSWYPRPWFGGLLYGVTAWIGVLWRQLKVEEDPLLRTPLQREMEAARGLVGVFGLLLLLLACFNLASGYLFFLGTLFSAFHLLVLYFFVAPASKKSSGAGVVASRLVVFFWNFMTVHNLGRVILAIFLLFPPLMGRLGNENPVEIAMAVLGSALIFQATLAALPFIHLASNVRSVLRFAIILSLVLLVVTYTLPPYDELHPKRVVVMQTIRFEPKDQLGVSLDRFTPTSSGILLASLDQTGIDPIMKALREKGVTSFGGLGDFSKAKRFQNDQSMEALYPFTEFLGGYEIPFPLSEAKTFGIISPYLTLLNETYDSAKDERTVYLRVVYEGLDAVTLFLDSKHLVGWSLDPLPPPTRGHYFLRRTGGFDSPHKWEFYLRFRGSKESSGPIKISLTSLHCAATPAVADALLRLPKWATAFGLFDSAATYYV